MFCSKLSLPHLKVNEPLSNLICWPPVIPWADAKVTCNTPVDPVYAAPTGVNLPPPETLVIESVTPYKFMYIITTTEYCVCKITGTTYKWMCIITTNFYSTTCSTYKLMLIRVSVIPIEILPA